MTKTSGRGAVVLCTALFFAFCVWMAGSLVFNYEDWVHFDAQSFAEGCFLAKQAYMLYNPRMGEMLMFIQGNMMENPLLFFQFINPVCLCLLAHFCFRLGVGRWAGGKRGDVVGLLFSMFSVLSIHSGIYWYSSNMSWLYPCTVAAGLLIAVERVFYGDFYFSLGRTLWMLPLAAIMGMSNNNTAIIVTALIGGSWLYDMLRQKRWIWPSLGYCLLGGVILGAFLCYVLAPGNAGRMEMSGWELSFSCWWNRSMLSSNNWIFHFICQMRPLLSLGVLLAIMWATGKLCLLKNKRFVLLFVTYGLLWVVSTLAPCWGQPRAYVPLDITMACLLAGMVTALLAEHVGRWWVAAAMCAHVALALTLIIPESCKVIAQGKALESVRQQACAAAAAGQHELVLEAGPLLEPLVIPGMTWCPKFIFRHTNNEVWNPIRTCKRAHYQEGKIHHQWGECPYAPEDGVYIGEAKNTWLAKPCGLEAVYCLEK